MKKTIAKQVIKGVVAIIIAVVSYLGGTAVGESED